MFNWRYYSARRTVLIGFGSLAFMAGIALAYFGLRSSSWGLAILAIVPLLFVRKVWYISIPAVLLVGFLLGLWRGSVFYQEVCSYRPLVGQKVVLQGKIRDDPTVDDKGRLNITIDSLNLNDQTMPGTASITSVQMIQPRRGDTIEVTGKLHEGFGGTQINIMSGKIKVIEAGNSWSERFRRAFSAAVYTNIPEPQASLGLGFLIGLKAMLPKNLNDQLKILGLTHIVVASGYNLTVLVRAARRVLGWSSKFQASFISFLLIFGFLMITGFSSSMARAALVTSLSLIAGYYGRQIHPALLLVFTGAITAAISPLYIWSDIGWYLSFLSFGGVLLLGPLVEHRIFKGQEPPILAQIAIETTCAQVVTLPLILFIFGQFAVLAILANLLIEPFIPLAMLLTFMVGVIGLALSPVASWVALPATWLLNYMTSLSGWMAQVPWAQLQVSISMIGLIVFYGLILAGSCLLFFKMRFNYLASKSNID